MVQEHHPLADSSQQIQPQVSLAGSSENNGAGFPEVSHHVLDPLLGQTTKPPQAAMTCAFSKAHLDLALLTSIKNSRPAIDNARRSRLPASLNQMTHVARRAQSTCQYGAPMIDRAPGDLCG
jgi:hypothetical protein